MKTSKNDDIKYLYDPKAKNLSIWVNGKNKGGFIGNIAQEQLLNLPDDTTLKFTTMFSDKKHSFKVRTLRALWIKQGIDDYRDAILASYGVKSTTDLTDEQLDELILKYRNKPPANEETRKYRSDILSLLNKLGIYNDNNDWSAVNNYLMDKRIAGKLLYQMTLEELKTLRKKLHSILQKQTNNAIKLNVSLN